MLGVYVLLASLGLAAPPRCILRAELEGPRDVSVGKEFNLRLTVTNSGKAACRFLRYWKWARNRMFLQLEGDSGEVLVSEPLLWDIDRTYDCFYVKPLDAGYTYSFTIRVNGGIGTVPLSLPRPGIYRVRWRYVGDAKASEVCPIADVEAWTSDLRSNDISVTVGGPGGKKSP